jgi:hypothetical protein
MHTPTQQTTTIDDGWPFITVFGCARFYKIRKEGKGEKLFYDRYIDRHSFISNTYIWLSRAS